jgi:prephenate dehydrogenase
MQITIIGTGLIGGSLGLALKKRGLTERIIGCDRPATLAEAQRCGAIDAAITDLREAVHGSDIVVLATPVGAVLDLIEQLGPVLPKDVLLTDVASTKAEIVERARAVFGDAAGERFLPGHPMAGKEHGGIEHADADLFEGAVWLTTPVIQDAELNRAALNRAELNDIGCRTLPLQGRVRLDAPENRTSIWFDIISQLGARVLVMDSSRHDRLCAWVSHLPQMLATALAASIEDEFGDDEELKAIGGRALREMTRIAASPYSMWRDIALTNTANIDEALQKLEQRLAHIRENLRTRALQEEFEKGNRFRKT